MKIYRIRGNYYNGKRREAIDLEEEDIGDECEDPEKSAAGGGGGRPIWEKFFAFNPKWIRSGSAAPEKRIGGSKPSKGKKKPIHLDLPEVAPADDQKPTDHDDTAAGKETSSDEDLQQPAAEVPANKFKFRGMTETEDEEEVMYLFLHVVKAKGLGPGDSAVPYYVAVQVGEHRLTTGLSEKRTRILEWNKVFAFAMDEIPTSSNLEVLLQNKSDECVGRVLFDLRDVRERLPGDGSPKAKWYEIEDVQRRGTEMRRKIGLAIWKGTEDDEAFIKAWHAGDSVSSIQPKVYETPRMWYLRVGVIEAQNLLFAAGNGSGDVEEHTRMLFVEAQLLNQVRRSRIAATRKLSSMWIEEFLFVVAEPFDEMLILTLKDRLPDGKNSVLGTLVLPLNSVEKRSGNRVISPRWFNLNRTAGSAPDQPAFAGNDENVCRIHLRICLEGAYHVMEETDMYTSDTLPADPELQKLQPPIGVLDLSILRAIDLVPTISRRSRHATTNAYCVAKYGRKWFRTRTILNSSNPQWHEKYSWEVFDPCTVINIGVFGNRKLRSGKSKSAPKDFCIGNIHIRISTIAVNRLHTHFYPLRNLLPKHGVTKMGELQLAVRFTCSSMTKLLSSYGKPLLPEMHYWQPISRTQLDKLQFDAMSIVRSRLCLEDPPLPAEVVEHMLDDPLTSLWSLRLSKATFFRVVSVLGGAISLYKVLDNARRWRSPVTTMILQAVLLILLWRSELILPLLFLYFFSVGLWNYRHRKLQPLPMDANILWMSKLVHPDELDEEFDTFPTSRPVDLVRMRYDRLRTVAGRFQMLAADLASLGEMLQGIMSWRDPWVTGLCMVFCLAAVVILFLTPFKVVAMAAVLYVFRHPRLRSERPSIPGNFFQRLPSKIHAMEWE